MPPASLQPPWPPFLAAVLGDLGRSPRMVQHALALADAGASVVLTGYLETPLDPRAASHPRIAVEPLAVAPAAARDASKLAFLWRTLWRVVGLHWALGQVLWRRAARGGVVLVQNPPSLPTLWLGWCLSRLRGARFVVDWHNFGFSMLALRFSDDGGVVRWARRYELWAGAKADGAFCVSRAMQARLDELGVRPQALVVYDRPAQLVQPLDRAGRRALLKQLLPAAPDADAVLVCPTSWTADEDIELLLEALEIRARRSERDGSSSPSLLVLLTGQGPLREAFAGRLRALRRPGVEVRTHFFSPDDYRRILRAADVGLSLHRSASGVDLPMKIVDFFAVRTPVFALDYGPCLAEQVRDGAGGRTFRTAAELEDLLRLSVGPESVAELRAGLDAHSPVWAEEALPAWEALRRRWSGDRG